jgi:hypothetical protein
VRRGGRARRIGARERNSRGGKRDLCFFIRTVQSIRMAMRLAWRYQPVKNDAAVGIGQGSGGNGIRRATGRRGPERARAEEIWPWAWWA